MTCTGDARQRPRKEEQLYDRRYCVTASQTSVFTAESAKLHSNSNDDSRFLCDLHREIVRKKIC
jgi:hypothetical protein